MSTQEKRIAASDQNDAIAIQNAMRFGRPLYFLQHVNGSVIDVGVDKGNFLRQKEEYIRTTPDGRHNIRLYERLQSALRAI
jgi:hypothetical protein